MAPIFGSMAGARCLIDHRRATLGSGARGHILIASGKMWLGFGKCGVGDRNIGFTYGLLTRGALGLLRQMSGLRGACHLDICYSEICLAKI